MQFVPGENLAARLERGERVDCDQLARELLEALAHIHAAGILHRDVKPGQHRPRTRRDGEADRLRDRPAARRDRADQTGLILGTERFAAPEVMEGKPATERSDLYSCGVVLRACGGPPSPRAGGVDRVVDRGDPRSRPRSARQALARLEREEPVLEEPTRAFAPEPEPETSREREPIAERRPGARRAPGRWGALAALLAALSQSRRSP